MLGDCIDIFECFVSLDLAEFVSLARVRDVIGSRCLHVICKRQNWCSQVFAIFGAIHGLYSQPQRTTRNCKLHTPHYVTTPQRHFQGGGLVLFKQ